LTLIIDSAPLVALGDAKDPLHRIVEKILVDEPGHLIVPAQVSAEADYLIRKYAGARAARLFLEDLAEDRFRVECLTQREYAMAGEVDQQYADLELGLADLAVVVLANRYRTRRILTFDQRDFRAASPLGGGSFKLLPFDDAAGPRRM